MSAESKPASSMPVDPQMPGSTSKNLALPKSSSPASYASKADESIIRLAKLIKTTAGLGSLLSVTSYSLYIAAYLHANSPARTEILSKVANLLGRTPPKLPASIAKPTPAGVSPLAPIISIINDTRFSIRLTGLIPLYVLLRTLIKKTNPADKVLHNLALLQASMYISFQMLENLWLLSGKSIVSSQHSMVQRFGGPLGLLKWSCRAWLVALTCDFLRLAREAQVAKDTDATKTMSKEEKEQVAQKWWSEFFTASAWYPMAIHYSMDGGIGLNQGLVGLCGMLGGFGGLSRAWAATKD